MDRFVINRRSRREADEYNSLAWLIGLLYHAGDGNIYTGCRRLYRHYVWLHQRRGGVVEPVPDRIPLNRSARVHAAGEAVRAAGVMPDREVLGPLLLRLGEGELDRAPEAGSGSLRRGRKNLRSPDGDRSGSRRGTVQAAEAVSGVGVVQPAGSSDDLGGAGRVYLNGVVELLDSDSDERDCVGAKEAPRGEAPESEEFPMLEFTDSDLQRIDERVSESQGSGKT